VGNFSLVKISDMSFRQCSYTIGWVTGRATITFLSHVEYVTS